jgi:hypothetical protein
MKIIKILRSKPQFGGEAHQKVLPDDYLSAAGESLALIIVQAWILAYFFSYENILSNPLKDRMGYNNVCVAWDVAPALYSSAFLFFLPVYFVVRFVLLDVARMSLDSSISTSRKALVFVLESMYAVSMVGVPLIFVVTPDLHPTAHTVLFLQLIMGRFVGVASQFIEKPAEVVVSSWVYLAVYGLVSLALCVNGFVTLAQHEGVTDPFFPWPVGMTVDFMWFACLPLTAHFLPRQGYLLVDTGFEPESEVEAKLMGGGEP